MTRLRKATLVLSLVLLTICPGAAEEVILVGLKNTSSGVLLSLVPPDGSLTAPFSLLVRDSFLPDGCGPRSFRCRDPLVLPLAPSLDSRQYIVLVPVTGGLLITDWRQRSPGDPLNISAHVVKPVVGNACDPLLALKTATGSIYMVCQGDRKLFLYSINLNASAIAGTTIPGYSLEYQLFSQPQFLSNFATNGENLVYFVDGNILASFDIQYVRVNDAVASLAPCDSPYRITYVGGLAMVVARCEGGNAFSAVYNTASGDVITEPGFVYACANDPDAWFYVRTCAAGFVVEGSQHKTLRIANGTDFQVAVCANDTLLVILSYDHASGKHAITLFNGSAQLLMADLALGCGASGCDLQVFSPYLLATGGTYPVVLTIRSGSISSDTLINSSDYYFLQLLLVVLSPSATLRPTNMTSLFSTFLATLQPTNMTSLFSTFLATSASPVVSLLADGAIAGIVIVSIVVMVGIVLTMVVVTVKKIRSKGTHTTCTNSIVKDVVANEGTHNIDDGVNCTCNIDGEEMVANSSTYNDGENEGAINGGTHKELVNTMYPITTEAQEASEHVPEGHIVAGTGPPVSVDNMHPSGLSLSPPENRKNFHLAAHLQHQQ